MYNRLKQLATDKTKRFQKGLLLQLSDSRFVLGTAPFSFHKKPLKGFYFPGFFFQNSLPWIKPHKLFFLNREELISCLSSQEKEPSDLREDPSKPFSSPSFIEFNTVFHQLKQQIKKGKPAKGSPCFF